MKDRIVFLAEIVVLISHFCESYKIKLSTLLTRRKAKSIFARKAGKPSQDEEFCDGHCSESLFPAQDLLSTPPSENLGYLTNAEQSEPSSSEPDQTLTFDSNSVAQTKSNELEFSVTPPLSPASDLSDSSAQSSVIFDLSQVNSQLDLSPEVTMNVEDIAKLLTQQNRELTEHWAEHISTLSKSLQHSHVTPTFPSNNSIPMPKFSGDAHEDVNEFLTNFNRTAVFYHLSPERKAEALPLFLTGSASIWFNTTPELKGRSFDHLSEALKKQFHSDSDVWLLRQRLNDTKQLPTETVSMFAAKIRRLCQRINLPRSECVNYFIQGLQPHIKSYVLLQRPGTFEDAEMHAKLKESLPEQAPTDRTDEILRALAQLQKTTADKSTPQVAAYGNYPTNPNQSGHSSDSKLPDKSELERIITQCLRQELRRSRDSRPTGQIQRERRSFDGRPICDFCNKPGHVMAVCRQRQNRGRDPRIPFPNRQPGPNHTFRRDQEFSRSTPRQPLN